jgi:long-chain acyl-CoA synthetase
MYETETSIYEYARHGCELYPNKTAIWFLEKEYNFRTIFERIDRFAGWLFSKGIGEGMVVSIHLPNCPEAIVAVYAVAKLGGICNMVHHLVPAEMLKGNLEFTESRMLITANPDCYGICEQVVFVIPGESMYEVKHGVPQKDDLLTTNVATDIECPSPKDLAYECAFYLHSSGSTGKPKTIKLSHSAINNCVDNTEDFFEDHDMAEQVSLGVLPLFHGFGIAMDMHRNLAFGSTLVIMPRWNAKAASQLIKQHKVSLMIGVPAMYYSLLQEDDFCGDGIKQLKRCFVGGDTVPAELAQLFNERLGGERHLLPGFGLTEATTVNCVNTRMNYKAGSAGYPVRNTSIAVIDADGILRPHGEGELVISSKTLMQGYLQDEDATSNTLFAAEGKTWTKTGDYVVIDEQGWLFFKDRIKNVIIHNGYNVYPLEVESVIKTIKGVTDVCVIGRTNNQTHTEDVYAFITKSVNSLSMDDIKKVCLNSIPRYAVPKEIILMDKLPLNTLGKVDREQLRKMQ